MDKAVELNPLEYLSIRAWCRYKFLRDYNGTLSDLTRLYKLNGSLGYSNDGDYDLRIVEALCHRELGNINESIKLLNDYFSKKESGLENLGVGVYDYLHMGVTLLKAARSQEAISYLERQITEYKELPDTYYYLGLCYRRLGDSQKAEQSFLQAKSLFTKGYKRYDTYTESLDKVYLSDVERVLREEMLKR
jgi:tetratricopeptide (TPR) repeat protein